MASRRPDYNLSAMVNGTFKGHIGAAWIHEGGHINIKLNPCTVIDTNATTDLVLTLFPNDRSLLGEATNGNAPTRKGKGKTKDDTAGDQL